MDQKYSLFNTELKPYEHGIHLNVRDDQGKMIGEINAMRKRRVDSLELKAVVKGLLSADDTFRVLVEKATKTLPAYTDTLEIRFIF